MALSQTPFEKFDADCHGSRPDDALSNLADYMVEQKRFHELFEVRKLQLRLRLGLPIEKWQAIDELPNDKGEDLEKGLLEICREIGTCFMKEGDVGHGWQYLEPAGERSQVAALLQGVEITDENVESVIQVSLGQGIQPELGFGLVLDRFGTCSSITAYESQLAIQSLNVRRGPARMLVNHLYRELVDRVSTCVAEKENRTPDSTRLIDLIKGRDWLFEGLGHHIDTTHLTSTVRIARVLVDPQAIENAMELAQYGLRLHQDFQYSGQIPFEDTYRDSLEFLQALRGSRQETAIDRLNKEAAQCADSGNLDAAAWLVYLLDQIGQGRQATTAYLKWIHVQQAESMMTDDICPNLMYLVSKYGCFEMTKAALLQQGDLLGYATVKSIEMQPNHG